MALATHPKQAKKPRVQQLAAQGHSKQAISHITGLAYDTVSRYLAVSKQEQSTLSEFRECVGDLLHADLLLGMQLKHKLLVSLGDEAIADMSVSDKRQFIRDLSVSNGTTFDKIRLHEGKSTGNISHRVLLEQTCQDEWTTKGKAREVSGDDEKPQ